MVGSRVSIEQPTAAQVRSALLHPSKGKVQFGWGGFDLQWGVTAPGFLVADRTTAQRRTLFVGNLDEAIDSEFAFDPIGRLQQHVAYLTRWGPEYGNRMQAEFGFLPGLFRSPDSRDPMTFSPHGVVVLLGHFGATAGTPVETWSCSTSHDVVGPDIGAMPNTIGATALEAIFDAWSGVILGTSFAAFNGEIWLDGVAYYRRMANGNSTTGVWERYLSPTPVRGINSGGAGAKALQDAMVVTEDAGGARKGRFGRIYLPAPDLAPTLGTLDHDARVTILGNVLDAFEGTNAALNTATGDTTETVVASAIGSGENRPVRTLKIGAVIDTQRRRRRSLDEDYVETAFQSV